MEVTLHGFLGSSCKLQASERDPKSQVLCHQQSAGGHSGHPCRGREGSQEIYKAVPVQQKGIPMQLVGLHVLHAVPKVASSPCFLGQQTATLSVTLAPFPQSILLLSCERSLQVSCKMYYGGWKKSLILSAFWNIYRYSEMPSKLELSSNFSVDWAFG